jgi:hypothetical protein
VHISKWLQSENGGILTWEMVRKDLALRLGQNGKNVIGDKNGGCEERETTSSVE